MWVAGSGPSPFHVSPSPAQSGNTQIFVEWVHTGQYFYGSHLIPPEVPGVCPVLLPCTACERLKMLPHPPKIASEESLEPEDLTVYRTGRKGLQRCD